jgi:transcription elongation factor Elf1
MRCKRCGGLMIVELCVEEELEEQIAGRGALRCVNCGARVNTRMLRNLATRHNQTLTFVQAGSPRNRHAVRVVRTRAQDL